MINGFQDLQKLGQENVNRAVESFGALPRGWQALALDFADVSTPAFQDGAGHVEKLLGTRTVECVLEAQAQFVRASYERTVGQVTRLGEIYLGVVRDAAKPFEALVPTTSK